MKGQTGFILALIFALIVAIFAVINVDSVEVNYLFGTGQAPLILVILGSVLMGGLIGGVFGAIRSYKLKRTNRTLQNKVEELETASNNPVNHEEPSIGAEEDQQIPSSAEQDTKK